MNKERTVSNVLGEMDILSLNAVSIMCDYASGLIKTVTPEAIDAAKRIRYEMNETQRKVAYYLVGCALEDHKKPIILQLFM